DEVNAGSVRDRGSARTAHRVGPQAVGVREAIGGVVHVERVGAKTGMNGYGALEVVQVGDSGADVHDVGAVAHVDDDRDAAHGPQDFVGAGVVAQVGRDRADVAVAESYLARVVAGGADKAANEGNHLVRIEEIVAARDPVDGQAAGDVGALCIDQGAAA